ncbi:MAG: GAF domain-containing protein, partial [Polyangia bacterium]
MSELDQSALELQALQRIIASGERAFDLDVVLDRCLEQALAVARADAGTLYLRDAKRKYYRLSASRNTPPDLAPSTLDIEERLKGDHKLHDLTELDKVEPLSVKARADGFTHGLVLVLLVDGRRVGFLGLLFKAKPILAESTMRTLEAIAAFEAVALESARVHQQVRLRSEVARTLNDCAERLLDPEADAPALILEAACKLGRGQGALLSSMAMRDGAEYAYITAAVGDDVPLIGMALPTTTPYLREALAQHAPTVVEDVSALDPTAPIAQVALAQGTKSFVLVTMRQSGRPLGQLFVKSNEPRVYADAEIEGLQLLSNMAAQALARARRQAEERVEHARIAAILEHLPVVVAVMNTKGEVVHINRAGRDFAQRMGSERLDWRESLSTMQVFDRDGKLVPPEQSGVARAF